ncbi:MAG: HEAT repeat domain-containing protein [bacterium]
MLAASGVVDAGQQTSKPAGVSEASATERKTWDALKERFTKYSNYMSGNIWSLIHTYESQAEMEQSLKLFESIMVSLASDDPATLKRFDGPKGYKSQLVQFMNSKDDTVSGFAAFLLAIIGDMKYAPQIAALLTRNINLPPDKYPPITVRGRAAVALSLLGAKQYTEQIVPLLKSQNDYDRSGAAMALGYLKATEHAKEVVELLLSEDLNLHDDDSAIHALFEMGVAANYKKEIAQVLGVERRWETSKTAAYALVRLGAKEYAKDIARRLEFQIGQGDAAKALALLGAKEYANEIASLLSNEDSFTREKAALALGILGARDHAPALAKLLKDNEWWVRMGAAKALVLMEATEYSREVLPIIAEQKGGAYFDPSDFNELVTEQVNQLDTRFRAQLTRMKGQLPASRLELQTGAGAYLARSGVPALAHQW